MGVTILKALDAPDDVFPGARSGGDPMLEPRGEAAMGEAGADGGEGPGPGRTPRMARLKSSGMGVVWTSMVLVTVIRSQGPVRAPGGMALSHSHTHNTRHS